MDWASLGHTVCIAVIVILSCGTIASLSRNPHWMIRGWDFPRVQIVVVVMLALSGFVLTYPAKAFALDRFGGLDWSIVTLALTLTAWHSAQMAAYTPLGTKQVLDAPDEADHAVGIRIVVSNVEMENESHATWMQTMRDEHPDVIVAIEVNERWVQSIRLLRDEYEYEVSYPQGNWYGMLVLSHFPLTDTDIRFLVQDDIPSIHTTLELPGGQPLRLIAVHPRPPEPLRNNDAKPRNAELVLIAKALDHNQPTIVCGDLNDVAWSPTTRLFLRLSGLLDPRRGRGFFNTFHADHAWFLFPLDHVFHSQHFKVRSIKRLSHVGSDHFPMMIDLHYARELMTEQSPIPPQEGDEELARDMVQEAAEEEVFADDAMESEPIDEQATGLAPLRRANPKPNTGPKRADEAQHQRHLRSPYQ